MKAIEGGRCSGVPILRLLPTATAAATGGHKAKSRHNSGGTTTSFVDCDKKRGRDVAWKSMVRCLEQGGRIFVEFSDTSAGSQSNGLIDLLIRKLRLNVSVCRLAQIAHHFAAGLYYDKCRVLHMRARSRNGRLRAARKVVRVKRVKRAGRLTECVAWHRGDGTAASGRHERI
jgi:hypothetical protein